MDRRRKAVLVATLVSCAAQTNSGPVSAQTIDESSNALCQALDCVDVGVEVCPGVDTFHWVALPAVHDYRNAEDLLARLPHVTSVKKWFPVPGGCLTYEWDGTTCRGSVDCDVIPEPNASERCGSDCFCIDEGMGLEVRTSQPVRWNLIGQDAPMRIPVRAGEDYLLSLPHSNTMPTARSLLFSNDLIVSRVSRLECSGSLTSVSRASSLPNDFPLDPSRAYFVHVAQDGVLALPQSSGKPPEPCLGEEYIVSGTSDATPYAWGIDTDGDVTTFESSDLEAPPVTPAGAGARTLAQALADDINAQGVGEIVAQVDPFHPEGAAVCITSPVGAMRPTLFVGATAGLQPDCDVNDAGPCVYNPEIDLAPLPPPFVFPTPTALEWTPTANLYDAIWGDLETLRESASVVESILGCLADDTESASVPLPDEALPPGAGRWFLVRARNFRARTPYDSGGPGQITSRDDQLAGIPSDCPLP